jgi:uridine kinase
LRDAPRRILIDGRSGSGKTELAKAILERRPEAQLVRLDDLYPGWDGLAQGSAAVPEIFRWAGWRRWDWEAHRPDVWISLDPTRPVIVEGVGAISRASRPLADLAIWIELDTASRKVRALDRDGDRYAPHWDRWAAQEQAFIRRENPASLADIVAQGPDRAIELLGLA